MWLEAINVSAMSNNRSNRLNKLKKLDKEATKLMFTFNKIILGGVITQDGKKGI